MFAAIVKHVKNVSILRRLIFALSQLPEELPDVWNYAIEFATMGKLWVRQMVCKTKEL